MIGCRWFGVRAVCLFAVLLSTRALAVNVPGTSVQLTWTAASGPVAGYAVQVSRNGAAFRVESNVTSAAVRVAGSIGETLLVRVAAFDTRGRSGPLSALSDSITFVTAPTPPRSGDTRADLDGNGRSDALAINLATGALVASLLAANGTRSWVTIGTPRDPAMRPVGFGDVDADGRADVLWRNPVTGTNEIWRMRGLTYSLIGLPSQAARFRVAAFRDFSGDGKADALFHDSVTGESLVWRLGAEGFVNTLAVDRAPTGMQLAAVGDVDGDRSPDFVWLNVTTRRLDAWLLRGLVPRAVVSLGTAAAVSRLEGAGDFDGNGTDDLAWTRTTPSGTVIDVWFLAGASAPKIGTTVLLAAGSTLRGVVDLDSNGKDELVVGSSATLYGVAVSPVRPSGSTTRWTVLSTALSGVPLASWKFLSLE